MSLDELFKQYNCTLEERYAVLTYLFILRGLKANMVFL